MQLSLLNSIIEVLLNSSETLNRATGKIRNLQILLGITQLLILVISYIVIIITENPIWAMAVTNIFYLLIFVPRIMINRPYIHITFKYYFKNVLCGIIIMSILATLTSLIPMYYMHNGWLRLIIVCIVSTMSIIVFSYLFVLTKEEKSKLLVFIRNKKCVIRRK